MQSLPKLFKPSMAMVEFLLRIILLIYPILLFLIRGGMNGSLFVITVISLWLLIAERKTNNNLFDRSCIAFSAAMSSGLIVILISQLYHQDLSARYFDSSTRFLLAVPIVLALRNVQMRKLSVIQYGFPLGAITALLAVLAADPTVSYNAATYYLNHIHLGDLALLLGFLSVFSIDWIEKDRFAVKLLKVLGLIAGLTVSVLSSARGGWIAIPVFIAVYIYIRTKGNFFKKVALATSLFGVIGLLGYLLVEPIHQRLWMIYSDLTVFSSGDIDTSIGVRLQLWKAAVHLIAESPFFGVGADGFGQAMDALSASGFITPVAAGMGKAEVHNEILAQTVRFGFLGFISIMAIYFVPFLLFLRAAKSGTHQQNGAAMMGMCVTLGFLVFGLTVETFDLKMTAAFYSLTVAVLLAMAIHKPGMNEK
ncbi:O-antigen ligase [mine drainage metagenome]|uniref:O-antigen ligase n=1 Tax=mine drainage metagenome TaxID=410659 RepID=A0A1J5TE12_9ZZZZ